MTKLETLTLNDNALDKVVKIQGTPYDRKRKLSAKTLKQIDTLTKKGATVAEIAKKLGLYPTTVRYHSDPAWRANYNANRSGAHTGKDTITTSNRVAYKRKLVAAGKIGA